MEAAVRLFAQKGFEGTSIRDLATEANVNVAMVNYYFGSKEKLFAALIESKGTYMRSRIGEILADKSTSEIEKIDLIIETFINRIFSNPDYHRVIHQELLMNKRLELHDQIIELFTYNTKTIINLIESGIKKGVFRKVDATLTMASLVGTINQVMLSKPMTRILIKASEDFDPYTNPALKKRLENYLKELLHNHLLINKD